MAPPTSSITRKNKRKKIKANKYPRSNQPKGTKGSKKRHLGKFKMQFRPLRKKRKNLKLINPFLKSMENNRNLASAKSKKRR